MIDPHYQRSLYKNYKNLIKSQKIKRIFNSSDLSDINSLKFKSKMYSIVSRSLKGLANQKVIMKQFNKEYSRALHFAIAKSMDKQGNVGLSSLLKDGSEFARKYYNIDIMEHKMTILPFIGKAFANLTGFLNRNNV